LVARWKKIPGDRAGVEFVLSKVEGAWEGRCRQV